MTRFRFLLLLASLGFGLLPGCATERTSTSGEHVSDIPWNRPESWEGTGPLGGMFNTR